MLPRILTLARPQHQTWLGLSRHERRLAEQVGN